MKVEKYFSFNGFNWAVCADEEILLNKLASEFFLYKCENKAPVHFRIEITKRTPDFKPPSFFISGKNYKFSLGWKERHFIFDHDLTGYEKIAACRTLTIYGGNHIRLREVVLSYVLSALGELNDLTGWHRIHALSFLFGSAALTVPLNSGGGKSSFTYWLNQNTQHQILSDETVFTNGDQAKGFYTKLALRVKPEADYETYTRKGNADKYLITIPVSRLTQDSGPLSLWLPSNVWRNWSFLASFVLGLGNTQMIEFMIRTDNLLGLARIFLSRVYIGLKLLRKVKLHFPWNKNEASNYFLIGGATGG